MNILVTHVYSNDNKGDAALLSVLLSDIRRGFGGARITVLTLDGISPGETFDGIPVKHSFMYYARDRYRNPVGKFFYGSYVGFYTLLWAFVRRTFGVRLPASRNLKEVIEQYEKADLIIPVGGGYIRAQKGLMATFVLFFIVHPFFFARLLGKKTIGYTQSVGPFGNAFQEWMAKEAVKKLDGIVVREDISLQLLRKWGVTRNVFTSVDSGFSFGSAKTKNIRNEIAMAPGQMLVGMTVRSWLKGEGQSKYEHVVAALADYIVDKHGAAVVFIPQVTVAHHGDDDREAGRRVHALMKHEKNAFVMNERYDHHTIKAIYGGLDFLVGTRFHSVIFALTSYVPCIAVEYEHKTRGIMRDLGLEQWVVPIAGVEARHLQNLFDTLVAGKTAYKDHLKKILPAYVAQSDQTIFTVKKAYESLAR